MSKYPERDLSWWGRTRDNLAWWIAQTALNHIATPWYRGMIGGAIKIGLVEAAKKPSD